MQLLSLLAWQDLMALAWFLVVWTGYAWYSRNASLRGATLLAVTNAWRRRWMLQATLRDPRIVDGNITQNLSSSPSFFASSTLIVIGGVLALFGATDKAADLVRDMPFAVNSTRTAFEFKLLVLDYFRLRLLPLHLGDAPVHLRRAHARCHAGARRIRRGPRGPRGLR